MKTKSIKHDPRYLDFFERFNRQEFFEAHEVLEQLWLESRDKPNGRYYQGLIMAAGAFVHFQNDRPKAASNLLKTAIERLKPYGAIHEAFGLGKFVECLESWLDLVEELEYKENPFNPRLAPKLKLLAK
jgi:hypothetical protein